jgi:hypothetical protein
VTKPAAKKRPRKLKPEEVEGLAGAAGAATGLGLGGVFPKLEENTPGALAMGLGFITKLLALACDPKDKPMIDAFATGAMMAGAAKMTANMVPKEEPLITEAKKALAYGEKLREVTPPTRRLTAKSSAR